MSQDFSASWDLRDFPGWRADRSSGETDELRTASAKVWPRVSAFARKELANKVSAEERKALTLEAWGDTLVSVAETLKRHRGKETIRDLESFLFGTYQHRLNRLLISEEKVSKVIEYRPSTQELEALDNARDEDWEKNLQDELLIKELLRRMDEWTRSVWLELRYGFSWKKIAKHLGMTEQQVKMRFRRNIDKLRRQIEGEDPTEDPPDAR